MAHVNIELEVFQGPFELLYHLIEKNKIDIYDIPISELVDQYMVYLDNLIEKKMDNISSFIVMATTLLEIKSKMLLPKIPVENEEELDPREELVKRLLEYKKIKEVTTEFKKREEESSAVLYKEADNVIRELKKEDHATLHDFLDGINIDDLYSAFQQVMTRKEDKIDRVRSSFRSVEKDVFTVDSKMSYIRDLIYVNEITYFSKIFHKNSRKIEKVVTFLAVLELMKGREIRITQDEVFGEIVILKREEEINENV